MNFMNRKKFDVYVDEAYHNQNIILLDVRSKEEFRDGHLAMSQNLPLDNIHNVNIDKNKMLYVYCRSGARSAQAVQYLKRLGYQNVMNIGGISSSRKSLERGSQNI